MRTSLHTLLHTKVHMYINKKKYSLAATSQLAHSAAELVAFDCQFVRLHLLMPVVVVVVVFAALAVAHFLRIFAFTQCGLNES